MPQHHIPKALREQPPPAPRAVMYGIGVEISPGQHGMTHGPVATEQELLETMPDDGSVLIQFNEDQSETVLWRWSGERWDAAAPATPPTQQPEPALKLRHLTLDSRQEASVLAGLRALQEDQSKRWADISTDAGLHSAMSDAEIEQLVQQIQFGAEAPTTRVVLEIDGGVLINAFGDMPFELAVLDADIEGANEDDVLEVDGQEVYPSMYGGGGAADDAARVRGVFDELRNHFGEEEGEPSGASDHAATDESPPLLQSCPTVNKLLQAVLRAAAHIVDPQARQDLLDSLEPFTRGVAVAFYSREEMAEQAPMNAEVSDAEIDAALERLVANFEHPWENFSSQFGEEVRQRAMDDCQTGHRRERS